MNNKKLYVGNLSYDTTEEELKAIFEQCGSVVSAKIITNRDTGTSKGFAFVEMSTPEEATQCISSFNGAHFAGRAIQVTEARPKENTGGGGGRPNGNFQRAGGGGGGRNSGYSRW